MSESHVIYPATLAGYFADVAAAEAAAAELEQLDLGPIAPHFERVNVFRRYVEADEVRPKANSGLLARLFRSRDDDERPIRNDAVVMVRGTQERLESLAEPALRRHGAREIHRYGSWDPQMRKPGEPGVPPQHPAR